jgi:leukotriene-A4 hydrolase
MGHRSFAKPVVRHVRATLAVALWLATAGPSAGCGTAGPAAAAPAQPAPAAGVLSSTARATLSDKRDQHSWADPDKVRARHVALDLSLDFAAKVVRGTAEISFDRPDQTAPLVLDTLGLIIAGVTGDDGRPRAFVLGKDQPVLGAPLTITLLPGDGRVKVSYQTTGRAEALQWLAAEQTRDRQQPFLFTQGESILTRSWIPLQDSPGVRVTYEARVTAPKGITVVMSAEQKGLQDGAFRFHMSEPIPPYLIALAAGRLAFAPISNRAGVYAEPSLVKAARDELVDTEKMIDAAESLFGPYRWGRYDIIVLPPSFPFGGMENPRLTFATPTILAGDKSLVGLVAHELAHSWSGNLVTNATWSDFWLNEGFTTYCEQRIMERVFGPERSNLEKSLARADLVKELGDLAPWAQALHPDLGTRTAGGTPLRHPDSAFSGVPYEKGSLLLQRLEAIVGREKFDGFLRGYFDGHAFASITTGDFVKSVETQLVPLGRAGTPAGTVAPPIDWQRWLLAPGLPDDAPQVQSSAIALVDVQLASYRKGTAPAQLSTTGWVTQQWQHFLKNLPAEITLDQMAELDRTFGFTKSGNSEIAADWLVVTIRRHYLPAQPRLEEFLLSVGRRKFLKPLYTELAKTPEGLAWARTLYSKARPRYHAVATSTIDQLLTWKAPG